MPLEIGSTLKKYRNEAQISVKQISDMLVKKGFKASEKTIYSWECGNSQPSPDALLVMCAAYGIKDVLSAFGYESTKNDNTLILNNHETELIEKYRTIATRSPEGKKNVDFMIDNEYDRCRPRDIPGQTSLFDLLTPEEREQVFARCNAALSGEASIGKTSKSQSSADPIQTFRMIEEMFNAMQQSDLAQDNALDKIISISSRVSDAKAAHNDHESEPGELENMREDIANLKRPE